MKEKPLTVAEFISAAPKSAQKHLREMRATLQKAAPDATESLKWSMPAFSYRRILFMYAPFKHHIGFYPTPSAIKAFAKQLLPYKTAKGSIQFSLDKPLPAALIRRIARYRVKESMEKDVKWM